MTHEWLVAYLVVMNVATFATFCVDKHRAVRHAWRIPEATLLWMSALGGSLGGICAMHLTHHKTRKPRFSVGLPAMLALQIAALAWAVTAGW